MREKLIYLLKLSPSCICDLCGEKGRLDEVAEIIADNLIANGVTIPVRCKDCVHSIWDEENEMWKCIESAEYDSNFGDYIGWVSYHNADFYCSYGERRTDDSRT